MYPSHPGAFSHFKLRMFHTHVGDPATPLLMARHAFLYLLCILHLLLFLFFFLLFLGTLVAAVLHWADTALIARAANRMAKVAFILPAECAVG